VPSHVDTVDVGAIDVDTPSDRLASDLEFCYESLDRVSRSFALTVPVLPQPLRDQVCVSYLLCRIADTIEDAEDIPVTLRQSALMSFREYISGLCGGRYDAAQASLSPVIIDWPRSGHDGYDTLMRQAMCVCRVFDRFPADVKGVISDCVDEMCVGMSSCLKPSHLQAAESVSPSSISCMSTTLEELERYCHYVAGVVGTMLTKLFDYQLYADEQIKSVGSYATAHGLAQGHRFGLGLQLTNIIKDRKEDWERGVSFLPEQWHCIDPVSQRMATQPDTYPDLDASAKDALIARTVAHLDQAKDYILSMPIEAEGIRLFCLWSVWIAVATMREAAMPGNTAPKIKKTELFEIIEATKASVADNATLQAQYTALRSSLK